MRRLVALLEVVGEKAGWLTAGQRAGGSSQKRLSPLCNLVDLLMVRRERAEKPL